ncbi:MAG: heme ABC transporter permease CcmB [Actinobacteria bacterium]|nr:MAG: heme ABC transporter permease CcmB [Actinomycetota bacterium]
MAVAESVRSAEVVGSRARSVSPVRQIGALLKKDMVAELRTKEMLTAMFLFALLAMIVFNYALGSTVKTGAQLDLTGIAGGLAWTIFTFMSLLGLNRSFVHEKDEGCLDGLLLAPVDRSLIYVSKMLGNLVFLLVVEAITLPVFAIFFVKVNFLPRLGWVLLSLLLGTLGVSAVGTLLATISINTKARDLMLPVLFLPVVIPVVIAAVQSTGAAISGAPEAMENMATWLGMLVFYDVIFTVAAYGLYDYVIGE